MASPASRSSHEGRKFQLPSARAAGLGKPLKLLAKPMQERIPIYLGAIGPKSVEQTGEIADGWIPFMFDPQTPGLIDPLRRRLAKAGRNRATSTSPPRCRWP